MEASELEALKDKQMEVKYQKMNIDRIYIDLYNILIKTIASLDLR